VDGVLLDNEAVNRDTLHHRQDIRTSFGIGILPHLNVRSSLIESPSSPQHGLVIMELRLPD
jgi:hypothetical protein